MLISSLSHERGKLDLEDAVRAFVLTIDQADGPRRRNTRRELEDLGIDWEFVTGFRKEDPSLRANYSRVLNLVAHKRSLSDTEIAVYAGHRLIWKRIADSEIDYALVLEDDSVFWIGICSGRHSQTVSIRRRIGTL